MRIYLIGYMCCGKSTIGKKIAKKIGYNFVDMDVMFEEKYKVAISTFFEKYGQEAFRILEQKLLHTTATMENMVIATGGGTPCFGDNMEWINANGLSIYLKTNEEFIVDRLKNTKKQRPLTKNISPDDLPSYVAENIKKREPYYTQANITMVNDEMDLSAIIAKIKEIQ